MTNKISQWSGAYFFTEIDYTLFQTLSPDKNMTLFSDLALSNASCPQGYLNYFQQ